MPRDDTADHARPDLRIVALVGLAAGALGGTFGVGGGLILVPGLLLVAKVEHRLAHGTSLFATLPIALASLSTYIVNGNVDWAVAPLMATGTVIGAVVGTKLLTILPKRTLTIIFTITVLATAIRLFLSAETTGRDDLTFAAAVLLIVIGLATGTLSGLLGIGGGVVMVPAMIVLFGMVPAVAKGTSVAVIVPTAMMGTWRNRQNANVDLKVGAIAGGCGVVTAIIGGIISDGLSDEVLNVTFACLLLFVATTQLLSLRAGRTARPAMTDV